MAGTLQPDDALLCDVCGSPVVVDKDGLECEECGAPLCSEDCQREHVCAEEPEV